MIFGDDDLSCFLRAARARPFAWGSWDCLMALAEWISIRRGVNPGAGWRYSTEEEAELIVKDAGGLVNHVDRCVRPFGIRRTEKPKRGDIAVVADPIAGPMGAVVLWPPDGARGTMACLVEGGLLIRRFRAAPLVAAWSV